MATKIRIEWIDILRCIGMFLVVIGHTSSDTDPNSLRYYIYSFHLPLFFIISGMGFYLQTNNKIYTIKEMIVKKINTLIIPYFILSLLSLPIWILNFKVLSWRESTIPEQLIAILYSNQVQFNAPSNALWFLPTLFLTSIAFFALMKWTKNDEKQLTITIVVISAIGYAMSLRTDKFHLPWHLDTVLMGILFFLIGYLFVKHYELIKEFLKDYKHQILWCLIALPIAIFFVHNNARISMHLNMYGSYLSFLIGVLGFSSICIIIAMNLPNFRVLSFIGQNTLVYLAFHSPIFRFIEVFSEASRDFFVENPILVGTIVFIILIPISYVFDRYFPYLIGRKKFIKE